MAKLLEVRCCCSPQKLLGWLPVDDSVRPGAVVRYCYRTRTEGRWACRDPLSVSDAPMVHTIPLVIGEIYINGDHWLALKAEGVPLEILRLIPGFQEDPRA